MRIALIADIHGNAVALDAVLADIEVQLANRIICLGDVTANGPQPQECLQRLRALACPVIMGNTDEWLLSDEAANPPECELSPHEAIFYWGAAQLNPEDRLYLETFSPHLEVPLDQNHELLCFHGSPRDPAEVIAASTPEREVMPMLEGHNAEIFVGGHTHLQILRRLPAGVFINPGSIGFPVECEPRAERALRWLPHAEYAIINWLDQMLSVAFYQVSYDFEKLRAAAEANMPHADWWLAKWRLD